MKYKLSDLADVAKVRTLTNLLHKATGISVSVIDSDGAVLADSGWHDICRRFHDVSPETRRWCRRQSGGSAIRAEAGQKYTVELCRNGLIDVATPITVAGKHVADFIVGQFLLTPPDVEFFKRQALRAGFDETAYLEAVSKVPVIDEAKLHALLQSVSVVTDILGEAGVRRFIQEMDKRKKEESPDAKSGNLEEVNAALRVLLEQREADKRGLEEDILSNVKELILPYMEKLKKSGLSAEQKSALDILEANLNEITSSIIRKMQTFGLTIREISVASLLKEGKSTKQVAELLGISGKAVEFHRYKIRKKLGIGHKETNLQSYLQSIGS